MERPVKRTQDLFTRAQRYRLCAILGATASTLLPKIENAVRQCRRKGLDACQVLKDRGDAHVSATSRLQKAAAALLKAVDRAETFYPEAVSHEFVQQRSDLSQEFYAEPYRGGTTQTSSLADLMALHGPPGTCPTTPELPLVWHAAHKARAALAELTEDLQLWNSAALARSKGKAGRKRHGRHQLASLLALWLIPDGHLTQHDRKRLMQLLRVVYPALGVPTPRKMSRELDEVLGAPFLQEQWKVRQEVRELGRKIEEKRVELKQIEAALEHAKRELTHLREGADAASTSGQDSDNKTVHGRNPTPKNC